MLPACFWPLTVFPNLQTKLSLHPIYVRASWHPHRLHRKPRCLAAVQNKIQNNLGAPLGGGGPSSGRYRLLQSSLFLRLRWLWYQSGDPRPMTIFHLRSAGWGSRMTE